MLKFSYFFAALLLLGSASLQAVELINRVDVFGGYRNLDFQQDVKFVLPQSDISDYIVLEKTKNKITNMNIGIIGIDLLLVCPQSCISSEMSFLENFYLAGFADWGWEGGESNFKQTSTSYPISNFPILTPSKGKTKNSDVSDYQIALGYLFNFENWGLSLMGGYAFSRQNIKLKHGKTYSILDDTFTDNSLFNSQYKFGTDWQGALLGFNLSKQYCNWNFATGYQYQFVNLAFKHPLKNSSDDLRVEVPLKSKTHNGSSNFAYFAAGYDFCGGWGMKIVAEYQDWFTRSYKTQSTDPTFPSGCFQIISKTRISTYSILGSLGCFF